MQARRVKILGLSLLALGAFLAVSASVAQAKWLVLVNKVSKTSVNLKATVEAGRLLVPGLNLKIKCSEGKAAGSASLSEENKKLAGSATVTFTGCVVLEFEKTCFPMSKEGATAQPNGTIIAKSNAKAFMEGTKVLVEAKSEGAAFTSLEILGASCPLEEVDYAVNGSITLEVENPLTDAVKHGVVLVKQALTYGGQTATLENDASTALKGSVEEESGLTTSIHLVNLPGCEPIC